MDNLTSEQRKKTMTAVKSAGTRLERRFFNALEEKGIQDIQYHCKDVLGKPDIVHSPGRLVVFVDSCFWHGCSRHLRMPASNVDYWRRKIARNRKRDRLVNERLKEEGWLVLRIWEHSIKNSRALKWWSTRISGLIEARASD